MSAEESGERAERPVPKDNSVYKRKEYWDERFAEEEEYEWLVDYSDVEALLKDVLADRRARILVIGCGNSSFSADLVDAGCTDVTSVDYSPVVIDRMREKHSVRGRRRAPRGRRSRAAPARRPTGRT